MTRTLIPLALVALGVLSSCEATKQARSVEPSGFLGDYSQLRPGDEDQALLRYLKPGLDLSGYDRIVIDPVELWLGKSSTDDADVRQHLADTLRAVVASQLAREFRVVGTAGVNTLRLRMAITDAEGAPPVSNVVTSIVPVGRALSRFREIASGRGIAVGRASFEAELLDSQTGERLAAGVDSRFGRKTISGSAQRWSDAESAYEHWAATMLQNVRRRR